MKLSALFLFAAGACLAHAEAFDPNKPVNPGSWYNDQYPGVPLGADRTRRPWDSIYSGEGTPKTNPPRRIINLSVHFPPYPPPLGEVSVALFLRPDPIPKLPAGALEQDVYETFAGPLSILLTQGSLSLELRDRLERYHARRASLLDELRARLAALPATDAPARERALAAFAATQAPALSVLETEAEQLRTDFSHRAAHQVSRRFWRDPFISVTWAGADTAGKALRSDAAFQDGLSPAQRLLLREFEMVVALGQDRDVPATRPGPIFLFSPATARLRLPVDLPAELSGSIEAYVAEKNALLRELRATLEAEDARFFESSRVRVLRTLAEKQAPRFAALDQLAEEIRRGLARLPAESPPVPAAPPLRENFRDYRFAVLEPGLSPAQRQLLFGATLTQLNVPFNL